MYPNVWVLLCSLFAAVMLHRQILLEEAHLRRIFGQAYEEYMGRVRRYMGRKG
jgi:protein-S-isoprenylcysteine O-methyltransferase Ste14